jgi:hypothetical protein
VAKPCSSGQHAVGSLSLLSILVDWLHRNVTLNYCRKPLNSH